MTFRRFLIHGFRQKCFVQKLWRKNYFFAALARSALRRVRVQSDLLDETAIEASVVVACTKGSFHKKRCTYFAPSLYFLGKLTRPRPNVGRFTVRTPRNSDRTLATRISDHNLVLFSTGVDSCTLVVDKTSRNKSMLHGMNVQYQLYYINCP